jgi:hypothetical protein
VGYYEELRRVEREMVAGGEVQLESVVGRMELRNTV